jgi:hypothetical protein
MMMPTLIARGGRPGRWYIDVDEYGSKIPVFHYCIYDLGGHPWPHQFLNGVVYDQKCGSNWESKREQIARAIALNGLVCMSYDTWERPPGTPGEGGRHRGGAGGPRYEGLWIATDILFDTNGERHQRFRLTDKLCDLRTPGGK